MAKALSQGRMGYSNSYTNPRIQSKRTSSSSSSSSLLKNNAMKTLDRKQTLPRLQKRSTKGSTTRSTTKASKKTSCSSSAKAAFFLPSNLSSASSSGNIQATLEILQATSRELQAKTKISLSYFAWMCRLIFLPDLTSSSSLSSSSSSSSSTKQHRSALYYAAINGHVTLVELYLSLYLMGSMKVTKESVTKECTFQEWFHLYGTKSSCLSHLFGTKEYDEYVHNTSVPGHVRQILSLKKVSISSVLEFVERILTKFGSGGGGGGCNVNVIEGQKKLLEYKVKLYTSFVDNSSKRKKSKGPNNKPKLVCEDLYDTADYQHGDFLSDEEDEDDEYVESTDGEYSNEEWNEEDENVPPTTNSSSTLEHHEQQLAELEELVKNDEFSIAFHDDDDVSFHSNSNPSDMVDTVPPPLTVVSKDEDDEDDESVISTELQDGWDLVSDVDSVKSIDSSLMKPSYKDILMQPQYIDLELVIVEDPNQVLKQHLKGDESKSTKVKASSPTPASTSSSSSSSPSEEDNRMDEETPVLTIEDEREGVKTQRGGKPSKMFKGEGKVRPPCEKNLQRVRSRNCKPSNMFGLTDTRSNSYAPQYY